MRTRTVLDGNAFYEIDEECMEKMQKEKNLKENRMRVEEKNKKNSVLVTGRKADCRKNQT